MRCVLEMHTEVEAHRIDAADVELHSITIRLVMAVTHRDFKSGCIDALMEADAVQPAMFVDS